MKLSNFFFWKDDSLLEHSVKIKHRAILSTIITTPPHTKKSHLLKIRVLLELKSKVHEKWFIYLKNNKQKIY